VLFESLLLKPSFHLYSTKGELSRYSDFSKILKKDWNLLWLQWDKLKFISNEKYNASIEKHLTILELNHWLYISYTNNQLPARHQYLLQEEIIPISNEIFNISTILINQLKEKNSAILLAHAADFRGYFTNASQQLTATATTSASPIWDNYKKSVKAATDAIHNIQKTQPYNNDLVTQLVNKLYKFILDADTYIQIQNIEDYYSLAKIQSKNIELTSSILSNLKNEKKLYIKQQQNHIKTWQFMYLLGKTLIAILALFTLFYLYTLRKNFANKITSSISSLIIKTDAIAQGQESTCLTPNSEVKELNSLIKSINLMAAQIFENQKVSESRLQLQFFYDRLNKTSMNSNTVKDFCHQTLNEIINLVDGLSGAIFVRSHSQDNQELPSLIAHYNIPKDYRAQYNKKIAGLPFEAFSNKKLVKKTFSPSNEKIVSATTSIPVRVIYCFPIIVYDKCLGVLEILSDEELLFNDSQISNICERIGLHIDNILKSIETLELLEATRQQKELLDINSAELQAQTRSLQHSETELEMQAEELKSTNEQIKQQQQQTLKQKQELEDLNSDLTQKSKQLELANQQKSIFLAKVNHELKTPLNSILMLAQTILHDKANLPNSTVESVDVILQSGNELLVLINDLLDLAQVQSNRLKLHYEWINIKSLARYINNQFKPYAENKNLKWSIDVDENTTDKIYSDSQRLSQILKNFLSNAFKFTTSGFVKLEIKSNDGFIFFTVTDSGIGIAEKHKNLIFESFQQIDSRSPGRQEGSGLGLSISKQLAERLKGIVIVESVESEGSTFTLKLPIDNTQAVIFEETEQTASLPSNKEPEASPQSEESIQFSTSAIDVPQETTVKPSTAFVSNKLKNKRILLVDDDMRSLFSLSLVLKNNGLQTVLADSVRLAKEKLDEEQIDLVVTDLTMPDADGYDLLSYINNTHYLSSLPVVILSGITSTESKNRCKNFGVVNFIEKPANEEVLLEVLANALGDSKK